MFPRNSTVFCCDVWLSPLWPNSTDLLSRIKFPRATFRGNWQIFQKQDFGMKPPRISTVWASFSWNGFVTFPRKRCEFAESGGNQTSWNLFLRKSPRSRRARWNCDYAKKIRLRQWSSAVTSSQFEKYGISSWNLRKCMQKICQNLLHTETLRILSLQAQIDFRKDRIWIYS